MGRPRFPPALSLPLLLAVSSCASVASPRPVDTDEDGVLDDRCPESPEDRDGFEDADGCPDPDNDGDSRPDTEDLCPNDPEDPDGFQDADGCPDPDNDGDRILDAEDACACHPEDENGVDDGDGCPDCATVTLTQEILQILSFVPFTADSAVLDGSTPSLDQLVTLMRSEPGLTRIGVHGHAFEERDPVGLSRRRAEAVRAHLVAQGVAPGRLHVHHHGDRFPVDPSAAAADRSRRVDFDIEETTLQREHTCGSVPAVPECGDGEPLQRIPVRGPYDLVMRYEENPVD